MGKYTKDMLESGKHVVELRNGDRKLYLNGSFIGQYFVELLTSYNDDLTITGHSSLDVVKVFSADSKRCSLKDILENPVPLLFERKIPATISKDEALKKLAEVYGKEVKVEW